jgi:hypothetical protein
MGLKFYLNKFLKVTNIESYTLSTLWKLKEVYTDFLDKTEGYDPDFPLSNFGNQGQKIGGTNIHTLERKPEFLSSDSEEEINFTEVPQDKRNSSSVNERALKFLKDNGL